MVAGELAKEAIRAAAEIVGDLEAGDPVVDEMTRDILTDLMMDHESSDSWFHKITKIDFSNPPEMGFYGVPRGLGEGWAVWSTGVSGL